MIFHLVLHVDTKVDKLKRKCYKKWRTKLDRKQVGECEKTNIFNQWYGNMPRRIASRVFSSVAREVPYVSMINVCAKESGRKVRCGHKKRTCLSLGCEKVPRRRRDRRLLSSLAFAERTVISDISRKTYVNKARHS